MRKSFRRNWYATKRKSSFIWTCLANEFGNIARQFPTLIFVGCYIKISGNRWKMFFYKCLQIANKPARKLLSSFAHSLYYTMLVWCLITEKKKILPVSFYFTDIKNKYCNISTLSRRQKIRQHTLGKSGVCSTSLRKHIKVSNIRESLICWNPLRPVIFLVLAPDIESRVTMTKKYNWWHQHIQWYHCWEMKGLG